MSKIIQGESHPMAKQELQPSLCHHALYIPEVSGRFHNPQHSSSHTSDFPGPSASKEDRTFNSPTSSPYSLLSPRDPGDFPFKLKVHTWLLKAQKGMTAQQPHMPLCPTHKDKT